MNRITLGNCLLVGAMLGLAACTASHGQGPEGEACGPTVCESGTVCCNESCGICIVPGEGCPAILCADAGPPAVDAAPGTMCGHEVCGPGAQCCSGCTPAQSYCAPIGQPCPRPACADAGPEPVDAGAAPRPCGGFGGITCEPHEFCDFPPGSYCGGDDSLGTCRPRPRSCPELPCRAVCGCDGHTYCNECEANAAGVSVASEGACEDGDCAPMDARGQGPCDAFHGYAWDGGDCRGVSGCSCQGSDCGALYPSRDACVADYRTCISDCRSTGCPDDSSCQLCWTSYVCLPDGAVC